jgi:hypothetical protein
LPEISRFLGIVIVMYFRDHAPPHFHAKYNDYEVVIHISDGVVEGRFPRRALRHTLEWYEIHQEELLANWELARDEKPLTKIPPLE